MSLMPELVETLTGRLPHLVVYIVLGDGLQ
jgi:hypothetical protein